MITDEPDPSHLLSDTLFAKGWAAVLPPSALDILEVLLDGSPPVHDAIDARLRSSTQRRDGLDSPAWDEFEPWFEECAPNVEADVDHSAVPAAPESMQGLSTAGRTADFERHLAARGLPVAHTLEAVLRLMVACDVVTISERGQYRINPLAPTPTSVIPIALARTRLA